METVTLNLPQDTYDEIVEAVIEVNDEPNPTRVTLAQYMSNILQAWAADRMRGEYVHAARSTDLGKLKTKFGSVRELRAARKAKQRGTPPPTS